MYISVYRKLRRRQALRSARRRSVPVIWIPDAHVTPDRGHLAADSARDEACFVAAVDRGKVAVRLAGQNDGLRLDSAEGLEKVAAIRGRVANVAVHPGP